MGLSIDLIKAVFPDKEVCCVGDLFQNGGTVYEYEPRREMKCDDGYYSVDKDYALVLHKYKNADEQWPEGFMKNHSNLDASLSKDRGDLLNNVVKINGDKVRKKTEEKSVEKSISHAKANDVQP